MVGKLCGGIAAVIFTKYTIIPNLEVLMKTEDKTTKLTRTPSKLRERFLRRLSFRNLTNPTNMNEEEMKVEGSQKSLNLRTRTMRKTLSVGTLMFQSVKNDDKEIAEIEHRDVTRFDRVLEGRSSIYFKAIHKPEIDEFNRQVGIIPEPEDDDLYEIIKSSVSSSINNILSFVNSRRNITQSINQPITHVINDEENNESKEFELTNEDEKQFEFQQNFEDSDNILELKELENVPKLQLKCQI